MSFGQEKTFLAAKISVQRKNMGPGAAKLGFNFYVEPVQRAKISVQRAKMGLRAAKMGFNFLVDRVQRKKMNIQRFG